MAAMNKGRWFVGGVAAATVIWIVEGIGGFMYLKPMQSALETHGLEMSLSAGSWLLSTLASLIAGMALVFLYILARSRFGPGPRSALVAGFALWTGGSLLSLLGYYMLGLFPAWLLLIWALLSLVELLLAALVGAWVYREPPGSPPD